MALSKEIKIDKIEVVEYSIVQVRERTSIMDDGREVSFSYTRWCITPGLDYSDQDSRVKTICQALHTEECVEEYKKFRSESEKRLPAATPENSIQFLDNSPLMTYNT